MTALPACVAESRTVVLGSGTRQSVQNMPSKRMPFWQCRVIEVVLCGVSHADFLHHPPGAGVSRHRERDDFGQSQRRETKCHGRPRTLRRVTAVPVFRVKAPTNLDAWHEMSFKTRNGKSNESSEPCDAWNLDGPK